MIFDYLRKNRATPLSLLFAFAVNAPLPPQNTTPEVQELRLLAREYAQKGPLMTRSRFERFSDLMKTTKETDIGAIAGLCGGHGSPSNSGGNAQPASPARRRQEGDACLLSFNYWI